MTSNYDQKGRLENLRWAKSTGEVLASFSYTFNGIDNIMRKRLDHLNADFDYSYNRVSWLTGEVCSGNADVTPPAYENHFATQEGGNESAPSNEVVVTPCPPTLAVPAYTSAWTYDNCGNRLTKQSTQFGDATYNYDEENRLLVEHTEEGNIEYGYDNNGNSISRTKWNGEAELYQYAWNNQTTKYVNPQGQAWSYMFTPEANRIAKVAPDGSSEWYMCDGTDAISDYNLAVGGGQYSYAASYIQELGIDSKLLKLFANALSPGTAFCSYVGDYQKTTHMFVTGQDSVGTTVCLYDSWGQNIAEDVPIVQTDRYRFTQREWDSESTQQFSRYRTYDPSLGRFFQSEPILTSRCLTHYLYADNEPIARIDRMGLQGQKWPWVKEEISSAAQDIFNMLKYCSFGVTLAKPNKTWVRAKFMHRNGDYYAKVLCPDAVEHTTYTHHAGYNGTAAVIESTPYQMPGRYEVKTGSPLKKAVEGFRALGQSRVALLTLAVTVLHEAKHIERLENADTHALELWSRWYWALKGDLGQPILGNERVPPVAQVRDLAARQYAASNAMEEGEAYGFVTNLSLASLWGFMQHVIPAPVDPIEALADLALLDAEWKKLRDDLEKKKKSQEQVATQLIPLERYLIKEKKQ